MNKEVITPKPQDEARRLQDKQDKERAAWEGMGPPVPEETETKDTTKQPAAPQKSGAV